MANRHRVRGLIVPWDIVGKTTIHGSPREVSVPKGSISCPPDKSWVKSFLGHRKSDGTGLSVGYLETVTVADRGLEVAFILGTSEAAARAVQAIKDKTDDGLSMELLDIRLAPGGKVIEFARLDAIALVPRPAFLTARVEHLEEID